MGRSIRMSAKALVWDMDGVIADTAPSHFRAWHQVARDQGIDFTEADFRETFGKRNPEIIAEKFGRHLSAQDAGSIARSKEAAFRRIAGQGVRPFPGVLELLHSANGAGWGMAVASSTPMENIELLTRALEISDLFQAVVCDGDVSRGKPDPEVFLLAAERLALPPGRCIVIEDAVAGVRAAKSAGMKCVAVANTHPAENLSEADIVVDSLRRVSLRTFESLLK